MEINIDNQSAINTSKFTHRLCSTPFYLNFCSMQISHLTSAINLLTKLLWIQSMSYSSVQTVQPNTINYTIKLMWRCFLSLTHSLTFAAASSKRACEQTNHVNQFNHTKYFPEPISIRNFRRNTVIPFLFVFLVAKSFTNISAQTSLPYDVSNKLFICLWFPWSRKFTTNHSWISQRQISMCSIFFIFFFVWFLLIW